MEDLEKFSSADIHGLSPRSPVLNLREWRGEWRLHAKSLVRNFTTVKQNEETLTNLESTENQPAENVEPGWTCDLAREILFTSDQSSSFGSLPINQRNTTLLNQDPIRQALGASFSSSNQDSIFPRNNDSNPKNRFEKINSTSVKKNSKVRRSPVLQVTKIPSSGKDEKHSYQLINHAGNHIPIPVLPVGSMDTKLVPREEESIIKPKSNMLCQNFTSERSLIPQLKYVGIDVVETPPKDPADASETVCTSVSPNHTKVIYSSDDESDEPRLLICLSPTFDTEIHDEKTRVTAEIKNNRIYSRKPTRQAEITGRSKVAGNGGNLDSIWTGYKITHLSTSSDQLDDGGNEVNSLDHKDKRDNSDKTVKCGLPSSTLNNYFSRRDGKENESVDVQKSSYQRKNMQDQGRKVNNCRISSARLVNERNEKSVAELYRASDVEKHSALSNDLQTVSTRIIHSNVEDKSDISIRTSIPAIKTVSSNDSYQSVNRQTVVGHNDCTGKMGKSTLFGKNISECSVSEGKGHNVINLAFRIKRRHSPDSVLTKKRASSSNDGKLQETTSLESVSNGDGATNNTLTVTRVLNFYVERNFEELRSTSTKSVPISKTVTNQLADTGLHLDDTPQSISSAVEDCSNMRTRTSGISEPILKRVKQVNTTDCNMAVSHEASKTRNTEDKFSISVPSTKKCFKQLVRSEGSLTRSKNSGKIMRFNFESFNMDNLISSLERDPHLQGVSRTDSLQSVKCTSLPAHLSVTQPDKCNTGTDTNRVQTVSFNYESLNIDKLGSSLECDQRLQGASRTIDLKSVRCTSLPTPDDCSTGIDSTESFSQYPPETDIISVSPKPVVKCSLPFDERDADGNKHVERCKIVEYALELRTKQSAMLRSLPVGSAAVDLVNKIIGKGVCRQFLLDNVCTTEQCSLSHTVELNFDVPGHDLKTSINSFSRWYLSHPKQLNFKVLLHLLSLLSCDFGDDLLVSILSFSPSLLQVAQNFRRPFGMKLIGKLVHLMNLSKEDAIRTILIFILTPDMKEAEITELLSSLGVHEKGMSNLHDSISCIWHINPCYSFSFSVLVAMLKECLQEMPPDFKYTKEKIIEELLKCSRDELRKNFHVIDRLLLKYFAINSFAAHKVRSFVFHGKVSEPEDDSTRIKRYDSRKVKNIGSVNYERQYWDFNEERKKRLSLKIAKILQEHETEEEEKEASTSIGLPSATDFKMEGVVDHVAIGDYCKLIRSLSLDGFTVDTSETMSRILKALRNHQYKRFCRIIFFSSEAKRCLESVMCELPYILAGLGRELPRTIYECLKLMPRPRLFDSSPYSRIRYKFLVAISSVVLIYYENRDFKSAMKLLKTMRACGVNPQGFLPERIGSEAYAVVCSEIHMECRCLTEAVNILLSSDCFKIVKYNWTLKLKDHFRALERIVFKLMELLVKKRLSSLAMNLFRAVLIGQEHINYPFDLSKYGEFVLSYSFIGHKDWNSTDGVTLYVLIQKFCPFGLKLVPTTFRSLVVELVRSKAPEYILRRILAACIHNKVYPAFTPGSIALGSNLLLEEMQFYLRHCFQFLIAQDRSAFLQVPCRVHFVKTSNPVRKSYPFLEDIKKVSTDFSAAIGRFKDAMKLLLGKVYDTLKLIYDPSLGDIVITPEGLDVIANTLVKVGE